MSKLMFLKISPGLILRKFLFDIAAELVNPVTLRILQDLLSGLDWLAALATFA